MLFNSIDFLIFFPVVVLIFYIIPQKTRNIWLLLSSYYFYMCWNAKYAVLLFTSTFITYLSGLFIEKFKEKIRLKKLIVFLSFLINLCILFYYKYTNFALGFLASIFETMNVQLNISTYDIILPVGISFYTFQALSYTMDVYRGDIYAEKNLLKYSLFVSFFPQLVAGPIERSKNMLVQLSTPKEFNLENARDGILLMLWGYFLKIVLSNRIAIFVDTVYGDYSTYTGIYLIIATVLFAIQIYCDFAGYSTIAMGAAEILGIKLMENFDAPYLSTSVNDFWRRWHISLTSWFKDYLYIPLGGGRRGKARKYINKLIVFLISGLWHGAEWSFVIWGGLNGLYQIIGEILQPIRDKIVVASNLHRNTSGHKLICIIRTFVLVDISWIFFRAQDIKASIAIIKGMLNANTNLGALLYGEIYECGLDERNFVLMIICIGILFAADYCKCKGIIIRKEIVKQDWWFRWLSIAVFVSLILLFGKYGPMFDKDSFIYFQF